MIPSVSTEFRRRVDAIVKINSLKEQLKDIPLKELKGLARSIFETHKDEEVGDTLFRNSQNDLFVSSAIVEIIKEKEGEKAVFELTGLRYPMSLKEKIKYSFTGNLPKYNPSCA
ncbi:MAG: hypothetical protein KKG60_02205 [Nanoarchaeota archaeon]|nr:hypothetical protein [Nanoarchaeota archaeon]